MPTFYNKQYFKPNWTDTRKSQTLNFLAGEDIPAKAFVKRDSIDPSIVFIWNGSGSATGYNLSQRDVKAGCRLDVVIDGYDLEGETGGSTSQTTELNILSGVTDTVFSVDKTLYSSVELMVTIQNLTTFSQKVFKLIAEWNLVSCRDGIFSRLGGVNTSVVCSVNASDFLVTITNNTLNSIRVKINTITLQ